MTGTEAVREYVRLKKLLAAEYSRVKKLTEKLQNLAPVSADVTDKVTCGKRGKKPLQNLSAIVNGWGLKVLLPKIRKNATH